MSNPGEQFFLDIIYTQFRNGILNNLFTGIAYGMYLALYLVSTRILLSKGSLMASRPHMFIFGTTTLIFVLATTAIILGPGLTLQAIPAIIDAIDPTAHVGYSAHKLDTITGVFAFITRINPILSDVVCAWRAIVLWKWDRKIIVILTLCILGSLAAAGYDLKLALQTHPGTQDEAGLENGKVAMIVVGPMLGTNVLSTALIGWKAWEYRRTMGRHLQEGSPSGRVGKVLGLLIESGLVYCLLWMFYVLSAFKVLPGAGSYIYNVVMLYVSCMYPAVIIIIVCLQIGQRTYFADEPVVASNGVLTTVYFSPGESATSGSSEPRTFISSDGGRYEAIELRAMGNKQT
ncbi:hypothetical protein BC834DRAFT_65865 [Gloeopeniophorella convolvens]|nr:hypothetical protein BC834DRAFT_65865 [Gloeopeniophorella convolvens]